MNKLLVGRLAKSYVIITLGAVVYALGFVWFYAPNQIGFGGITGLGQIVNHFFPIAPIGVVVILLNVPLFLLGWWLLGGHLLISSVYAMTISSVFIDIITFIFGEFTPMDPILAAIFGGLFMGGSLGLVFLQGATTGGTDLVARLMKLKMAWLPMGKLLMIIDLVVIVAVALAFQSLYSALYGLVALYISAVIMDKVLYGMDTAKVAYIISDYPQMVADAIIKRMDRGVTLLNGVGGFSQAPKQVILCAFKQRQIITLKVIVTSIDPTAFLIVTDAHEVLGDGFREYKHNDI